MSAAINLCTFIESECTLPPIVRIQSDAHRAKLLRQSDAPPPASPPIIISTISSEIDSEATLPPLVRIKDNAPPPIVRISLPPIGHAISRHAPNRLLSAKNLKELIEPELSCCPVCKNTRRTLKDGAMHGLEHTFFIQCEICESNDLELRKTVMYLTSVLDKKLSRKDKKRIQNKITKTKAKLANLRNGK